MQTVEAPPPRPWPLPFFAWAIPAECQWLDIATREPHPHPARDLLVALAPVPTETGE